MDDEGVDDDEPVLWVYRNNGCVWALFAVYNDGIVEPLEIFGSRTEMYRDASRRFPVKIDLRPSELGCESSDEERAAIAVFATAYDTLVKLGRSRMV